MARVKSLTKRGAILNAAVHEIAKAGLGASTAKIAKRAGIASGTLFTYFASKEELLNDLYLELKLEVYERINDDFPHDASLERRARHVWTSYLGWAIEFPAKRRVSAQLGLSNAARAAADRGVPAVRGAIDATLKELGERGALRGMPAGFAAATMTAIQEATMDFVARRPQERERLIEGAFEVFWSTVR